MKTPKISVIMNCYNSASYLREALESVLTQSYQDWELVFWDNQSTDQSAEIFRSYKDSRFLYFRAETHTNLGQARNLAVSKAKGMWLAFLDCDDVWAAVKLEKQQQQIKNTNNMIGLVYCPVEYKIMSQRKHAVSQASCYKRMKINPHQARSIYLDLLGGNLIIFSSLLVRRDLYLKVGGIDDTLSQNEDYDLVLKVSRIALATCIESIGTVYRIHDANNSYAQAELNYQENFRIYRSLPSDKNVDYALKLNYSRYSIYKLRNGRIFAGLKMLLIDGMPLWVIKRSFIRLFQKVRRDSTL